MIKNVEIFPWNCNFEVGIETIDRQHKQLVHLINKVALQASQGQSSTDALQIVLQELNDYVEYHFRSEEKIMLQYLENEPEASDHLKAHHDFEDTVSALMRELELKSVKR